MGTKTLSLYLKSYVSSIFAVLGIYKWRLVGRVGPRDGCCLGYYKVGMVAPSLVHLLLLLAIQLFLQVSILCLDE